jgi:hypothetical protein
LTPPPPPSENRTPAEFLRAAELPVIDGDRYARGLTVRVEHVQAGFLAREEHLHGLAVTDRHIHGGTKARRAIEVRRGDELKIPPAEAVTGKGRDLDPLGCRGANDGKGASQDGDDRHELGGKDPRGPGSGPAPVKR